MTTKMSRFISILLTVAAATTLEQGAARACGGFFCNRPPPDGSLPIAQAGESWNTPPVSWPVSGSERMPPGRAKRQELPVSSYTSSR